GGACQKFQGRFAQFIQYIRTVIDDGATVIIILPGMGQINRMAEILSPLKFSVLINDNFFRNPIARKTIYLNEGYMPEGFAVPSEKLFVFSSYEAYGERQVLFNKELVFESKTRARDRYKKIASHLELEDGDYVVHVNYGIGIYRGMKLLSTGGRESDYLLVEYAESDKLYVPVDALHMLHRYVGVDGASPRIGKLNDSSWKKQRSQAQRSVEKLAAYLVTLYAKRSVASGHRFGLDNELQKIFEESFQYKETSDQENAILEVKCDMESDKPMDRLVCGDVGFGKTEVAIRAAFKACMDGKQVAFLAPTTILSLQHYNTLVSRFATFAINVELLSRFRTKAQQSVVVEKLKEGKVDVVIGTHRILQKDIMFKDLGLLIVDEEQRFGVKHKERLKELKHHVDILTLTATPIPRTLYMSMVGCRDISIINTPPAERLPVKTFVLRYSDDIIKEAITREVMRKGQVYYVHNRIDSIDAVANKIAALVPGVRVRYAHGQMEEKQLEKIIMDFYEKEFDVLVSTTIIENGLDISNVNTMIIERADTFGLSQLYQLRGRVGRAKNQAYAYFLFPHEAALTDIAKRRLQAMKEFSELGSGYKIAMRDLEIRGAGNLLGHEQHGHICTIGFELYCRLLEEEVKKIKGEEIEQRVDFDCEIDLNINAYIPSTYINSTYQKIDIYKRMVGASNFDELGELSAELIERFGKYPETVHNLFQVVKIKVLGRRLKACSVKEDKKQIMFKFQDGGQIKPDSIAALIKKYAGAVKFSNADDGATLLYLLKQDLKGENLIQLIISVLQILNA
ncbi:MAG TPA: transcription-repair coupling factor, partial [Candidatus Wallbacteria bacterium]|nr:transcription-repair coupling factor [Candidatus Wallbacteria bacterium]